MKIIRAKDYADMSRKAANILGAQIILKPNSVLGLATGSTPVGTYRRLVEGYKEGDLDFSSVSTVNLDEYCGLGPDSPQSYRYFMNVNLFDHVNIEKENTHVPNGLESDAEKECARYEALIERLGGIDIQLLGIGHNGHIGFNEPTSSLTSRTRVKTLTERTRADNARFFDSPDDVPHHCVTQGLGTIMAARNVVLVATGEAKADAVAHVIEGPVTAMCPASVLQMHQFATVIIDESAAAHLQLADYYKQVYANLPAWQKLDLS